MAAVIGLSLQAVPALARSGCATVGADADRFIAIAMPQPPAVPGFFLISCNDHPRQNRIP